MQEIKKILLVQLLANGDCLLGTTVARQVKNDFPDSHLTWAVAGFCKSILYNNPYIDEIMEVNEAPKNDRPAFRKFRKKILEQKEAGIWDEVFIIQLADDNIAYYDGCIRSATLRAYKNAITVPVIPVLRITAGEKEKVRLFTEKNNLSEYKHVILFEFAPMSRQSKITRDFAIQLSEELVKRPDTVVILSSGNSLDHAYKQLLDGSVLSIRETAELTNYCTFLIGSSSGITWASTSDAARKLPMVQILEPDSLFFNSVARDFKRQGFDASSVIELTDMSVMNVADCVNEALENFTGARMKYHEELPVKFHTTRAIVYNLLCYAQFNAIAIHIRVNREVYGNNISFFKEVLTGFLIFPFRLAMNTVRKRILKK